jgi:hypothetical protein
MGQLQQALLAVGAAIIIAVLGFNLWQSAQLRRRRARADAGEAAAPAERQEPGLDAGPADATAVAPEPARLRVVAPHIDPLIDAIASFLFDPPLPGESLQQRLPRAARAGTKPMLFEGRNAQSGVWEPLQAGERYAELQAAVQMASRAGALNAIEYSEFVGKCHDLGEALGNAPDLPDMAEVLEQARDLDAFAAANDAQLSINLQAQGVAWGVDFLRQQAQLAGFSAALAAGRLALLDTTPDDPEHAAEGGRPVAVVQLHYDAELADNPDVSVSRATLLLDVPQVPQALQPFARMREAALRLAQGLDARQVDDNGAPLSASVLDQIGGQLTQLYAALDARGLHAGGSAAQRLFS